MPLEEKDGMTQNTEKEDCKHAIYPPSDCVMCIEEKKAKELNKEEKDGNSN